VNDERKIFGGSIKKTNDPYKCAENSVNDEDKIFVGSKKSEKKNNDPHGWAENSVNEEDNFFGGSKTSENEDDLYRYANNSVNEVDKIFGGSKQSERKEDEQNSVNDEGRFFGGSKKGEKPEDDLYEWAQRIQDKYNKRSPAAVEKAKRLAIQQTRASGNYRALNQLQFSNVASSAAFLSGLEQCAVTDKQPKNQRTSGYERAQKNSTNQMQQAGTLHTYENVNFDNIGAQTTGNIQQEETALRLAEVVGLPQNSEIYQSIQQLQQEQEHRGAGPIYQRLSSCQGNSITSSTNSSPVVMLARNTKLSGEQETNKLLASLKEDPSDDAARAAKWAIYDMASTTLTDTRRVLFEIWDGCKDDFTETHHSVKATIENDLKGIDKPEHMGIESVDHEWFVYGMAKKVVANTSMVDAVMRNISTKLELLGNQTECPVCYDKFAQNVEVAILPCAHMVCRDCWLHWELVQKAMQQTAFCPMCRQDAFVTSIVKHATQLNPN